MVVNGILILLVFWLMVCRYCKEGWPFNTEFYPILNLAWGGAWGGYKGVDETALPTTMKVDYLRVFQK